MKFSEMSYQRPDLDGLKQALSGLVERLKNAQSYGEAKAVFLEKERALKHIDTLATLASVRHSIDTRDEFYDGEEKFWNNAMPQLQEYVQAWTAAMLASPFRKDFAAEYGDLMFINAEIQLKTFSRSIIPQLQQENDLTTEYEKLLASAQIPFEGKTYTLSQLTPFKTDADDARRLAAWKAEGRWYKDNQEKLDGIYDQLTHLRDDMGKKLGYEGYTTLGYYRMGRNCYGQKEVESFRRQIKQYFVPFAEKLHERRRQRLGLDKLSYIDQAVYFKQGNPAPTGTPEEIMAAGQKMYRELSSETGEFFDFMMENQLFDVLGRKNKRAGGYMTYMPDYHSPFIFANFNGTSGDVDVVTHECGHAFQGYLSGQDPIREHADITMETAEIHSMSMEFMTENWMGLFFGDRKQDYIDMHLEDSAIFIPYGCMVDEFQHIVYENPDMTPAQRHTAWLQLEAEYRPHMDYGDNPFFGKGGLWQQQLHIYNAPLYYIDYCLAQTCALQYKIWKDKDFKAAWASYIKLCRLSASDFFTRMIPAVGLKNPFEDGSIRSLVESLEASV